MELLAPAGDLKSFYAAVYNGADAVYLGLQTFNARMKADNFNTENLAEIVAFAHLYHVKVYVTINILVKDTEVDAFLDTVRACVRAHVDAYIIQDLGMAQLLLAHFPQIVLHASTQMGIHNLSGAKFLESLGFKRVVLARETKLADIKLIREQTKLEIEYFGQGALCVAFSGNCYLSAWKNGHSGNRGECLQLCRLPYQIFAGNQPLKAGYYLSAKDLCLMQRLPELMQVGVDCLKIEGRLKRASYVAQVTRSYRQAIDNFSAVDIEQEQAKMSALFSRGEFNEQAYLDDNFKIINPQIGHHQGKKIGRVLAVTRFKQIYKITLWITQAIGQNDALRLVQGKNQFSLGVGNVNFLENGCVEIFSTRKVPADCEVYLLKSEAKEKLLTDYVKRLPLDFSLTARAGSPARLVARCDDVAVTVMSDQLLELARTAGLTQEQAMKQLGKLNDTKFYLHHGECDLDNVFVAVSTLNELRRKAIKTLEQAMLAQYQVKLPRIVETKSGAQPVCNVPPRNFYLIADAKDLPKGNINGFDLIICPTEYSESHLCQLVTTLQALGLPAKSLYLNLPTVATETEMTMLDQILAKLQIGIIANNYGHLRWVKQYKTIAGIGLNIFNQFTAQAWLKLGCENFIWSLEQQPTTSYGSALVSGYPALMTFCHCPVREIFGSDCGKCHYRSDLIYQDEKHNRYRLRRVKIQHCYFELFSEERYEKVTNTGKIYDLREYHGKI